MEGSLKALKNKEVINVASGRRMGFVTDAELDMSDARLLAIVVSGGGGIFSRGEDAVIPWACIEHIGEDLILVNVKEPLPKVR